MPRISCIIPVYNGERYLGEAIDSALVQTLRPHEIIVVDDGSTDASARVAAGYGARVRLLCQPHAGRPVACNRGLTAARGDLVGFLDADDLWHPDKLERQVAGLWRRPEAAYGVTAIQNFVSPELEDRRSQLDPSLFRAVPGFVLQTLLARRELFDRVGVFDPSLSHAHDTDWFVRVQASGVAGDVLEEVLVRRRLHLGNVSQHARAGSTAEYLHLIKTILDRRRRTGTLQRAGT